MHSRLGRYVLVGVCLLAPLAAGCSLRGDGQGGGDILFVRERANGDSAIYLMSNDGGDVRRVVAGDSPRWSPDGTRFAYTADNAYGNSSLWVMNPETREKRRVVAEGASSSACAWAPDGVRLAYTDGRRILVVNTETRDSELVSLDLLVDGLDWSPDGGKLLVTSGPVKVLDLRTGSERAVSPRRRVEDGRWSPDGGRVVFAQQNHRYNPRRKSFDLPSDNLLKGAIVVADRDGSSRERATGGAAFDSDPAFSDDGERIYFARRPAWQLFEEVSGQSEIYVVDLETRSLRRLTKSAATERSPDPRPAHRSLPDPPEPVTGDVVVPDLVGQHVLVENERRQFRALGLKLRVLPFAVKQGWLTVVQDQVPLGGSRVPRGTVVKVDGWELASIWAHFGKRFSAERWKGHSGCAGRTPRVRMYWDLVEHVLREGMSRERVVSLLGQPSSSNPGSAVWPVGQLSTEPVDCIYLRVEFDRRGRVTRFFQSLR